jgi:hypothetical protein
LARRALLFLFRLRLVFRRREPVERAVKPRGEAIAVRVFGAAARVDDFRHGRNVRRLILVGEHDGEHALRDVRVGRVGRAVLQVLVVVVDFPEERFVIELECPEVVLAKRVILRREVIERAHRLECASGEVNAAESDPASDYEVQ